MPRVASVIEVPGAATARVWEVVRETEGYAHRAGHVLEVSRRTDGDLEWAVLFNGSRVAWVLREEVQPSWRVRFEQVHGDLDQLRGVIEVAPAPAGSRVSLVIDFELGIDGLAPLFDPLWARSFERHADALLRAVSDQVSEGQAFVR